MKIHHLFVLALTVASPVCAAEGLPNLSVAPELTPRLEKAMSQAKACPVPGWCNTPELKRDRQVVIEKCLRSLYHNHLAPKGAIHFEGVVPSPTTFNGLWSWDSWKHAYALAGVDRELAENSIRALYDYQSPEGMIPDCIFVDTNNFTGSTCVNKLTKPPLSG